MSRTDPIEALCEWAADYTSSSVFSFSQNAAQIEVPWSSPIERIFCVGMYAYGLGRSMFRVHVCRQDESINNPSGMTGILLRPQYQFGRYRIDYAIRVPGVECDWAPKLLFVECDGHDFHDRTKEQASADRERDRAIQMAGHTIFRFTGSDLYRDPAKCIEQVGSWVEETFFAN